MHTLSTSTGKIINGKAHAAAIRKELAGSIVVASGNRMPCLAVVLVGDNPASLVYIKHKQKACEEIGFDFVMETMPVDVAPCELFDTIDRLNADDDVDGIIVQQPLPVHICKNEVAARISPQKDVDCLHPTNIGLLAAGGGELLPCTPAGIVQLIKRENLDIAGKHAVIIGRSDIVGKPLALLLLQQNATVTICHSRTQNLQEICSTADVLIAAVGVPKLVSDAFVKPGAIVIDVGVNRTETGLCGDVDYEKVRSIASYITPVPGGVGPMTIAMLMSNVWKSYKTRVK